MNISTPDILPTIDQTRPFAAGTSNQSPHSGHSPLSGADTGSAFGTMLRQYHSHSLLPLQSAFNSTTTEDAARRKAAEDAASGLVSNALILPVLKQLRRSPWGGEGVFSGGIGEKTFGPQFDMQLADRIAQSPRLGIKKALADRMLKKGPQAVKNDVQKTGLDVHG